MCSCEYLLPPFFLQLVQALRYETPEFMEQFSDEEEEKKEEEEEEAKKDLSLEATYSEGYTCICI